MIYLKNLNSQVKEFKDTDTKTIDVMVDSGRWIRVQADYSIDHLGTKVTADIIYGMKLLDESGDLRGLQLVNLGG